MDKKKLKKGILQYLEKHDSGVPMFKLKMAITDDPNEQAVISGIISELLDDNTVEFTSRGIVLYTKCLQQYINRKDNDEERCAFTAYLSGQSVPGQTAHEIRDRLRTYLKGRPVLEEDRYRPIFRKYKFDSKSFCYIFEQPISTYIYLRETSHKGHIDWREIRRDMQQPPVLRQKVLDLIKSVGLLEGGCSIPFSVKDITLYLLEQHPDGIDISHLYEEYRSFLNKRAPLPPGLDCTRKIYERVLTTIDGLIYGFGKQLRRRNSSENRDQRLLQKLKLSRYRNQYISTAIIFRDSTAVLQKGDIQNSYELYSLLKANNSICQKYHIQFSAAPYVTIGKGDAVEQLKSLLRELSPIPANQLAKEYEQRYGINATTARRKFFPSISQYLQGGKYNMKARLLTPRQQSRLRKAMPGMWYLVDDVKEIFSKQIGKNSGIYLSAENYAQLGFKTTTSIIYREKFASLDDCLNHCLWSKDTFEVPDELWEINSVYGSLQKRESTLEIINYAPQKYINLRLLKRHGIHKKNLYAYIKKIENSIEDETYFTFYSMDAAHVDPAIDELGFGEYFYYSLLRHSKKIQCRRVAGTYLFRKSANDATLPDFIEYVLSGIGSIDTYDFSDLIMEQYGIELSHSYIVQLARNTNMYYDSISEKIFIDYDEYDEYLEEI